MVYHDFVEPAFEYAGAYGKTGWGTNEDIVAPDPRYYDPSIVNNIASFGCVTEPADVKVYWSAGKTPLFSQNPSGRNWTDAWTVPYGSFFDYFKRKMGTNSHLEFFMLGCWETTALFGHEEQLRDALNGGT